jgi:Subtilase family
MKLSHMVAAIALPAALLASPAAAMADGAESPQAVAADAQFLSTAGAPPGDAGGVCVIDSGVDANSDLGSALIDRFASVDLGVGDDLGATGDTGDSLAKHGTYVAGVIASQVDGVGASGIWPAAKIYSNRVFTGLNSGTTAAAYINAMNWCTDSGRDVKVINLSLSGLMMSTAERSVLGNKIHEIREASVNVVAAAGNNGLGTLAYPAAYPQVFSVGATNADQTLAPFSNFGPDLDIATIGTNVCVTTTSASHLGLANGTSFAAPIVSAALDALRSWKPSLTPSEAEARLLSSAKTVNGTKVLDVKQAFIDEGLQSVVNAYASTGPAPCEQVVTRPAASSGGWGSGTVVVQEPDTPPTATPPAPNGSAAAEPPPVIAPMVSVKLPSESAFAKRKPRNPTLKTLSFRHGVLRLTIQGRRAGERAIFRVDNRRYVRHASALRVKTKRWKRITVQLQRPGVGRSRTLTVRPGQEF